MKLTILRGAHTMGMIDEVVAHSKDANVIFFESITTKQQKIDGSNFFNRISTDEAYANSPEVLAALNQPNPLNRIGWELRHNHPLFFLVDKTLADDESVGQFLEDSSLAITPENLDKLEDNSSGLDEFIAATQLRCQQVVAGIIERDKLVARQIKNCIAYVQSVGKPCDNLVLVAGFFHVSRPYIQKLLPELEIVQDRFNETQLPAATHEANGRLILHKRQHLTETVPPTLIKQSLLMTFKIWAYADKASQLDINDHQARMDYQNKLLAADAVALEAPFLKHTPAEIDELTTKAIKTIHTTASEAEKKEALRKLLD